MTEKNLNQYLPPQADLFILNWLKNYPTQIKIKQNRATKLGDYKKNKNGVHNISINYNLPKELFFFVLTHEIAHLLAFEKFGRKIQSHGKEWKITFVHLLIESLEIYCTEFQKILKDFIKNPKASFHAYPPIVKYFYPTDLKKNTIENLDIGSSFHYQNHLYVLEKKLKKNFLCTQTKTQKKYIFKPWVEIEK